MKDSLFKKITNLEKMIENFESPENIMKEVENIFSMIDKADDDVKEKAMMLMVEMAMHLLQGLDEKALGKLISMLKMLDEEVTTKETIVKVKEFKDAYLININKRTPYGNLVSTLSKITKKFDESLDELEGIFYNKKLKTLHFEYETDTYKEIILEIESWKMSEETIEVYAEGLIEYLEK